MGEELREQVKKRYAGAARSVLEGAGASSCCGSAGECGLDSEALGVDWTGGGYSAEELGGLPEAAGDASLGCGNPTALATLSPGEVVLDLGSGGGIDVLLSAKRVSPGGKAYGLDMTDEMLELAEMNRAEAGAENAQFLKGHIEDVPLPEDHVDVVISNCVINLSADKARVISEAYRVLKPGGRFAVSDMVFLGDKGKLPAELVRSMEAWSGCVSGALEKDEYEKLLGEAGFEDVSVEVTHTYEEEFASASGCCGGSGCCGDTAAVTATTTAAATEVPLASAFIRGRKPAGRGTL
ncbi:MAG TPA: arsenite methyltransferase [Rubrobacter sp.]|jgi:ubiquinone/menaquinone biosynthesis C-methylase UbiE|nr:arsenite methyltransferase [Rubrobacter sp.]